MALRLGLRQVKGLAEADAMRLVAARGAGYRDAHDLWRKSGLARAALERLAAADALRSLSRASGGLDRRQGLWALKALGEAPLPLFQALPLDGGGLGGGDRAAAPVQLSSRQAEKSPPPRLSPIEGEGLNPTREKEALAAALLPPMPLGEHVVEDYAATGLTIKRHPLAFLRAELAQQGLVCASDLAVLPVGSRIAIAGLVLIRQRPGSANGVVFITLEDETGIANLIVWPAALERFRRAALGATLLYCRGRLQREESVIHLVAEDLKDWTARLDTLRDRSGTEAPTSSSGGRSGAPRGAIPGSGPPGLLVASRDFR